MADIELVIKISEEAYKARKHWVINPKRMVNEVDKAIANGTVLPKGHGNLIDTNEITAFRELECNGHNVESLDEFTTIIEADKEIELESN